MANETKQTIFLKEIAYKHHPIYMNSNLSFQQELLEIVYKSPKSINIENITEEAIAYRGGYNFVDKKSKDYDDIDESDSKTGTMNPITKKVEISGLGNKIGAIRLCIWNTILNRIDYMFFPYAIWKYNLGTKCYGKNTDDKIRLQMRWNEKKDSYNKFEVFKLNNFCELSSMQEETFYLSHPEFDYLKSIESSNSLLTPDLNLSSKNHPS